MIPSAEQHKAALDAKVSALVARMRGFQMPKFAIDAADVLESLQSDLSSAREEIAELRAALDRIACLRPAGPTRNRLVEQMERVALEALRSSRTKGETS